MASRRIAPTKELRASALGQCTTRYRAAFGGCRSCARLVTRDHLGNSMHRKLTTPTTLDRIHAPTGCASASAASAPPLRPFFRSLLDEGGGNAVIQTE